MTDITSTLEADSTQLNAVDFTDAGRIFTVKTVRVTGGDQPVNILLVETGKEYRPSKSMRRVLARCWGADSEPWSGRRFELYCDPKVKWGGKEVGGIKIRAVSHIDAPLKVMLQESSTVRAPHTVQPLPTESAPATEPTAEQVAASTNTDDLRAMWDAAGPERREQIKARVAELTGETA